MRVQILQQPLHIFDKVDGAAQLARTEKPIAAAGIAEADWIIDLGPEGGVRGGEILFCGSPAEMIISGQSVTAEHLRAED
ncbi:hypothetical protein [Saccharibacillus alkalitolerans]|uniref:Uncharacterized protein n=1 Tax=Saccharibacillus alkalitolerans TaxID=2705290 RepID=A0ABX0F2S3_9BACL|nr:hypothetical protein [Saccharibacillus alkalitolerans]NGZ74668.1 hypothetical protein [Saccharibacillus alkalitolerans]